MNHLTDNEMQLRAALRFHKVPRDAWGRLPGMVRESVLRHDYGYDVASFSDAHSYAYGCKLARTVGSDRTECDTHHAYVSHGVPAILRDI